jgi:hypothetical protein
MYCKLRVWCAVACCITILPSLETRYPAHCIGPISSPHQSPDFFGTRLVPWYLSEQDNDNPLVGYGTTWFLPPSIICACKEEIDPELDIPSSNITFLMDFTGVIVEVDRYSLLFRKFQPAIIWSWEPLLLHLCNLCRCFPCADVPYPCQCFLCADVPYNYRVLDYTRYIANLNHRPNRNYCCGNTSTRKVWLIRHWHSEIRIVGQQWASQYPMQ